MKAWVFINFIYVELLSKYHLLQTEGIGVGGYSSWGHQVTYR